MEISLRYLTSTSHSDYQTLLGVPSPPQLNFLADPWSFADIGSYCQTGEATDHSWSGQIDLNTPRLIEDDIPISMTTLTSARDARLLFGEITSIGEEIDPDSLDYISKITSQLNDILPERNDGDLVKNTQKLLGSNILDASFQLLRYSIYLSSNNLLSTDHMDKLLRWIVRCGQFHIVDRLIRTKKPTTEIFASNLLVSATRLQYRKAVRALIVLGVDVNIPSGQALKTTALYEAVALNDIPLVHTLLQAGAGPNTKSESLRKISPLQKALDGSKDLDLIRMLLKAGADVNIAPDEMYLPQTALLRAVMNDDVELVRMFLAARAHVNVMTKSSMTALQGAAERNNIEIAHILLDAGADIDAPNGNIYKDARGAAETAVAISQYQHWFLDPSLNTPIQHAVRNNNTEMVQILLYSGANVDGYIPISLQEDEGKNNEGEDDDEDDKKYYFDYSCIRTPLQEAVCNENSVMVRLLLLAGAQVDGYEYGPTPLRIAAQLNSVKLVRLLLRNGASINITSEMDGRTALQEAVAAGHTDVFQALIDARANVNIPAGPKLGRTALQAAVESGNTELVETLSGLGADVNAEPSPVSGRTCLQAAAETGNAELVKRLIRLGADVNAKPSPVRGRTCLQAAASFGCPQIIKILLKFGADINAAAALKYGRTALQAALEHGHMPAVDLLLDARADINAAASLIGGASALYIAVKNDDTALVERLLKTANPNDETNREPPLVKAAKIGATRSVKCLIHAGANINSCSRFYYRRTALQAAIEYSHNDVVRVLLNAGTDPNYSIDPVLTNRPLDLAANGYHSELVQLLLSKGANVNTLSDCAPPYTTALGEALSSDWYPEMHTNSLDIIRILIMAGADINVASAKHGMLLYNAIDRENLDLVKLLLNAGADVNSICYCGATALKKSINTDSIDIVQTLLRAGANVNVPAGKFWGRTALQIAVMRGKVPLVALLLQHGADCNLPAGESFSVTALQAAAIGGHFQIVLLLLRAGADINAPAAKEGSRTALEAAAEHGRLDIVSLLLKNDTEMEGFEMRCQRAAKLAESNGNIFISNLLKGYKKA